MLTKNYWKKKLTVKNQQKRQISKGDPPEKEEKILDKTNTVNYVKKRLLYMYDNLLNRFWKRNLARFLFIHWLYWPKLTTMCILKTLSRCVVTLL